MKMVTLLLKELEITREAPKEEVRELQFTDFGYKVIDDNAIRVQANDVVDSYK